MLGIAAIRLGLALQPTLAVAHRLIMRVWALRRKWIECPVNLDLTLAGRILVTVQSPAIPVLLGPLHDQDAIWAMDLVVLYRHLFRDSVGKDRYATPQGLAIRPIQAGYGRPKSQLAESSQNIHMGVSLISDSTAGDSTYGVAAEQLLKLRGQTTPSTAASSLRPL